MERNKRLVVVIFGYLAWQIIFPIICSPLILGILTAEQMGYTLTAAPMGIVVGAVVTTLLGLFSGTRVGLSMYSRAFHHIKTKKQLDRAWNVQLYGCYDGPIAETHWSGTVLPLVMMGFAIIGFPYPFNAVPAILTRWLLHVGVHVMFPREETGDRAWGSMSFTAMGLLLQDTISSACFLATGSIIPPIMLHTLSGPLSQMVGNRKKIAKKLGLPLE